jgi:hypothetical protein
MTVPIPVPLPSVFKTGRVVWRAINTVKDSPNDLDALPDALSVVGSITFTPTAPILLYTGDPSVTNFVSPETYDMMSDGTLRDDQGAFGVSLPATNSPDVSPTDWEWTATYRLYNGLVRGSIAFKLPYGTTVDLTKSVPITITGGTPVFQGPQGVPGSQWPIVVNGNDAYFPRPDVETAVIWVGTVTPLYADDDLDVFIPVTENEEDGPTPPYHLTIADVVASPLVKTAAVDAVESEIESVLPARLSTSQLQAMFSSRSGAKAVGQGELALNVLDYGAVPDWNGVTGTDNLAVFEAAHLAAVNGSKIIVPPGRYFLSNTFVISKLIDFDCAAGGITENDVGTQLVFPAGVTGIRVTAPVGWRIGPFNIKSLSTAAGSDVGVFAGGAGSGRGTIDRTVVESFGSHGFHLKAGTAFGGGNVNGSQLISPRARANRGAGIRVEGTDANAVVLFKPDVVANYGYGIELVSASMCAVFSPHADQQYNSSPGAYRDAGNSNLWDWVYSEGGAGFLIDTGSSWGRVTMSNYGKPTISTVGSGYVSWEIRDGGARRTKNEIYDAGSTTRWGFQVGSYGAGWFEFVQFTSGARLMRVDATLAASYWNTHFRPEGNGAWDLGSAANMWRNAFFSSYVRVGAVATASRPSATTAGAGAHMFDTTLGKPIWSNGTAWVDATGAVV